MTNNESHHSNQNTDKKNQREAQKEVGLSIIRREIEKG
jgi:hypothetical protein